MPIVTSKPENSKLKFVHGPTFYFFTENCAVNKRFLWHFGKWYMTVTIFSHKFWLP